MRENHKKKTTVIIGDSTIKKVNGFKLGKTIERTKGKKENIIVKSFPGATLNCMIHYVKPSIAKKPERIILHCGTNDLKNVKKPAEEITNNIIDLAKEVKWEEIEIVVSTLTAREDKLKEKASKVNTLLEERCKDNDINLVSHLQHYEISFIASWHSFKRKRYLSNYKEF